MFSTNYQEVNDIIPAGVYEAMITSAKEDGKITIGLEIRKDVEQADRQLQLLADHADRKIRSPAGGQELCETG